MGISFPSSGTKTFFDDVHCSIMHKTRNFWPSLTLMFCLCGATSFDFFLPSLIFSLIFILSPPFHQLRMPITPLISYSSPAPKCEGGFLLPFLPWIWWIKPSPPSFTPFSSTQPHTTTTTLRHPPGLVKKDRNPMFILIFSWFFLFTLFVEILSDIFGCLLSNGILCLQNVNGYNSGLHSLRSYNVLHFFLTNQ